MGTRVTPSAIHFADKALAGVPRLLDDLQRLVEDRETADIVFIVGREEVPIYAHRLILRASPTPGWHHYENKRRLERGLPIFASQSQFGGHAAILKEPFNGSLSRVKKFFFSCGGKGLFREAEEKEGY
ncbi:uncharacterized protein CDAR_621581 [Caerostris darwini]|uniref:BTB domain-containing protein n=1 Tax=Caerostris darwini TaxID=1538125 RepID=A0AAV4P7Y5_9ARAC|nr:uncharacterized protein CDAR_621581 [Caerostris darwini]